MKKNETNRVYKNEKKIRKRRQRNVSEYLILCCVVQYVVGKNAETQHNSFKQLAAQCKTFHFLLIPICHTKERARIRINRKKPQHNTKQK